MSEIKLENPNDVQELERLRILANKLHNWIQLYKPTCEEALWHINFSNSCRLEELGEIVCDDLGYYDANTQITVTVEDKKI